VIVLPPLSSRSILVAFGSGVGQLVLSGVSSNPIVLPPSHFAVNGNGLVVVGSTATTGSALLGLTVTDSLGHQANMIVSVTVYGKRERERERECVCMCVCVHFLG
jgi:hypothetical protein